MPQTTRRRPRFRRGQPAGPSEGAPRVPPAGLDRLPGMTIPRLAAVLVPGCMFALPAPGAAQAPAAEVRVTNHLDYVATAEYAAWKDRLDVYAPANAKDAPVVVSIHGGALREGDKYMEGFVGQRL